jgi:hypothetical protein
MTSNDIDTAEQRDPRETILDSVRTAHAATLSTVKTVVERIAPVTSKIPTVSVPRPEKLPLSDRIPSKESVSAGVAGAREFAGQLRDEQRKFHGELRKTAAGLHPVFGAGSGEEAAIAEGPHGPGSAHPLEDGSSPHERFHVKGNADSMLFHGRESQHYDRTKAEVWFDSEESAAAAGYKHWDHRKR